MATLTWRNVDAPNFSGALEGYRTAAQLLGNATRSGSDLVDTFTKANSDIADRAILQRAMGVQDSDAMRRGLTDGSIVGPDAQNASLETLRGVDNRVGTLLNRDVIRQGYDDRAYTQGRTRDANTRLDAAADPMADLEVASRNGDARTVNAILQANPQMRALLPDQFSAAVDRANSLGSNFQTRRGTEEAFGMTTRNNDRTIRDQNDEDAALKASLILQGESADAEGAQRSYNRLSEGMTPGAKLRLQNAARGMGYQINAPVSSGSPTAGVGGTAAASVMTGGAVLPDNIRTIGDLITNKSSLLKTNPKGTATGLYQITADTWADFAPRALGGAWQTADIRDPVVQDKVARSIWETVKGNPEAMRGRWASLSTAESEKLKDSTWESVRDTLSQKESGALASELLSPREASFATNLVEQRIRERAGQNVAVGIGPELNSLQGDRRTVAQVADAITQENGAFRGSNRGEMIDYINWIVDNSRPTSGPNRQPRINAATAAEILSRNIESADSPGTRVGSMIADVVGAPFGRKVRTGNLAGGIRLNDQGVYAMIDQYKEGGTSKQVTGQTVLADEVATLRSAESKYNSANLKYQALLSQSKTRPGLKDSVDRAKAEADKAEQDFLRVFGSTTTRESSTPNYSQ